jgi:iron(III) transport system permease protein
MHRADNYRQNRDSASGYCLLTLLAIAAGLVLFLAEQRTRWLLVNTALLATATCATSLPIASLLAWLLVRTDVPGKGLARVLIVSMLFVPLYLQTAAWDAGFGQQGWFQLSYVTGDRPLLAGWYGTVWVHAMAAIPWSVLIIGIGLRFVPAELEEAALLDAAPLRTFWHVTRPQIAVSLAVAFVWTAVWTAGEVTVTDVFQVPTYAEELFIGFALGAQTDNSGPQGSDLGVLPGVALVACLVAGALYVCGRLVPGDDSDAFRKPRTYRLGLCRWPAAFFLTVCLLGLVAVPVGNLMYKAGVIVQQFGAQRIRSWSAWEFLRTVALSPGEFSEDFLWSLSIGSLASILAVTAAVPLAYAATRAPRRSLVVIVPAAVCLALPGPLLGMGLIALLNRPESDIVAYLYDQTVLAPCVAMTVKALPLTLLILWYAFRTIPREMLDAAMVDGAGVTGRLVRVVVPQRVGVIGGAFLIALAVSMGDLGAVFLVAPPGVTTLSVRIFGLVHYGVEKQLAGLCLCTWIFFMILAAVTATTLAGRRGQ